MSEASKILFKETQHLAPRWFFPVLAGFMLLINLAIMLMYRTVQCESCFSDIVFFVTSPFIVLLFQFIKMETEIDENGIEIRMSPFVRKRYLFNEISNMYIRKYRPIVEYGGWGIKGWKKSNRAFNMKGDTGLQLELLNTDRVLIGTQKPEELAMVIEGVKQ